MADKTTFIKVDRNILNWGWFKDSKVFHVFMFLLLKANIKDGRFLQETVKRGSIVTSNAHISETCGMTIDSVRTALRHLEETGEIVRNTRNRYQLITIVNYDAYQSDLVKMTWQPLGQIPTNPEVKSQQSKNKRKKEGKNNTPQPPTGGQSPSGVIPEMYKDMNFQSYDEYERWRNQ